MKTVLESYVGELKIGGRQVHKNLAVYPLISNYLIELDYLLLDEALAEGVIEIVEVSKEGSVPELKVVNRSDRMVLILDGEELVGSKQNRTVNTTILVPGKTTLVIPVSCVEQGRWTYASPRFSSEERIMPAGIRAMKADQVNYSLRTIGVHRSDQLAVWESIAEKAARRSAGSPSMAMAEIYKKDSSSLREYAKRFRPVESQLGAIFVINGNVAGMDSFGKPETLSRVFRKLVESYALDAIDRQDPEKEARAHKSRITAFLRETLMAAAEPHPAVGAGTDYRITSEKITGFALCLKDRLLHLSTFARQGNGRDKGLSGRRMSRFSDRAARR